MRGSVFLQGLISCLIVAFGQPSFAPWLSPLAAAFGYALFWRAIRIFPFSKQRFWRAGVWYSFISLVQLSWMSSIEFQGIYILFVWLFLSLCLGVQFGLLSILIPYNRPLTMARILAMASVWTLLEWSRFHILCGYSWNLSGMALSVAPALQFAALFGILGLSFWVVFVNLLAVRAFLRRGIFHYAIWIGAALIPYAFGQVHTLYHERQMAKKENAKDFSCLLVQTGLLPSEKMPLGGRIRSFISPYDQWKRILTFLQSEGDKGAQLIVLPEAVVPFENGRCVYEREKVEGIFQEVFGKDCRRDFPSMVAPFGVAGEGRVSNAFWTQTISNLFDSEIVVGLTHSEDNGNSYVSAFHLQPHREEQERYDKQVLMPLAEYLPSRWLLPLVRSYGVSGFFTRGKQERVFDGEIPLSVSICYEETFPHIIRQGRRKGAKLLVNVTNDGWYPYSRLPSQHFEHARLRSVENGAALIRACNTGVTAAIDSLGRTVAKLDECDDQGQILAGALFAKFNPYEYFTLYTLWGNWGIVSLSLFFIGIFAFLKKEFRW
ncbi:MAG: Apolipoprotein N-acyltransferase [Chlamydiae bacterium]|nr:Apolipoprotein N-acyltransferase [Chlamydiota bacterium]